MNEADMCVNYCYEVRKTVLPGTRYTRTVIFNVLGLMTDSNAHEIVPYG